MKESTPRRLEPTTVALEIWTVGAANKTLFSMGVPGAAMVEEMRQEVNATKEYSMMPVFVVQTRDVVDMKLDDGQ